MVEFLRGLAKPITSLLLYPGLGVWELGPAMLNNLGRVVIVVESESNINIVNY